MPGSKMNACVGDLVRVAVKVLIAVYVIVDVNDMVGVKVSVGSMWP